MKIKISVLFFFVALFSVILVLPAKAAVLTNASATVDTPYINNASRYTISFTVGSSTEIEGRVRIMFPAGFDISSAANATTTITVNAPASTIVASSTVSGQELNLWLADGSVNTVAVHISGIPNIVNHATAATYTFGVQTYTQAGDVSETGDVASSTAFTISGVGTTATTKKSYNINFSSSPSGAGTVPSSDSYVQGTTLMANAVPKSGYDFVAWEENGVEISKSSNISFIVNAKRDLVARFKAIESGVTPTAETEITPETTLTPVEELKAKIVEVQQKIIVLIQQLIQLIQQQISG